eukprot:COSAG05_NODE_12738_length_456_cov_1.302521_1_plen_74_part_01
MLSHCATAAASWHSAGETAYLCVGDAVLVDPPTPYRHHELLHIHRRVLPRAAIEERRKYRETLTAHMHALGNVL